MPAHETTTKLIGNTIDALLRFPDELQRLKGNPGLLKSCIEEGALRKAHNQLVIAGSRPISEIRRRNTIGRHLYPYRLGAANRDLRAVSRARPFFDPGREPTAISRFGSGVHSACPRRHGTIAKAAGPAARRMCLGGHGEAHTKRRSQTRNGGWVGPGSKRSGSGNCAGSRLAAPMPIWI